MPCIIVCERGRQSQNGGVRGSSYPSYPGAWHVSVCVRPGARCEHPLCPCQWVTAVCACATGGQEMWWCSLRARCRVLHEVRYCCGAEVCVSSAEGVEGREAACEKPIHDASCVSRCGDLLRCPCRFCFSRELSCTCRPGLLTAATPQPLYAPFPPPLFSPCLKHGTSSADVIYPARATSTTAQPR